MFRFTIRDVLWLMVVVALAGGWAVERQGRKGEKSNYSVFRGRPRGTEGGF